MMLFADQLETPQLQKFILGSVAPRPIGFISTVDKEGAVNLSPFSFFNAFSASPPILIFSPARHIRDNTTKHTLENVMQHSEVTVNIVNHAMVEQASLASTEYEKGVNEFIKSGLTPMPSQKVSPPYVKESPVAFECKVKDIIHLGEAGGSGNLILCEILVLHIKDEVLEANKKEINPFKLDAVARMGGDWYCRANDAALFQLPKPIKNKGIGVDNIPEAIKNSEVLTGNNLGRLGNIEELPSQKEVEAFRKESIIENLYQSHKRGHDLEHAIHLLAKQLLEKGNTKDAWKTLLQEY